jgi:hypothetical protein
VGTRLFRPTVNYGPGGTNLLPEQQTNAAKHLPNSLTGPPPPQQPENASPLAYPLNAGAFSMEPTYDAASNLVYTQTHPPQPYAQPHAQPYASYGGPQASFDLTVDIAAQPQDVQQHFLQQQFDAGRRL